MSETHDRMRERGDADTTLADVVEGIKSGTDGQLKALVFGADSTARRSLHNMLRERGHDVVSTDDAGTARELFGRHRSDMVFLCGLDGPAFDLSKHVRRIEGDRSVVVGYMTSPDTAVARTALEANLDETIIDRYDQLELARKL